VTARLQVAGRPQNPWCWRGPRELAPCSQCHEPEPWQTNATAPFLTIEKPRGIVSIWGLGKERFRVEAPGHDLKVEGYQEARALAHQLAEGLQ
jgi:hypothetical protein